jgi:hypothetical protein
MNNGEPVYLTPEHYMGMQWNQMADTGGYKEFHMAQANMYSLACLIDKVCWYVFSPRTWTGFTEMVLDHLEVINNYKIKK